MALKTFNNELPFIKPGWTGNQLTDNGLYTNLYGDDIKGFSDVLRMLRSPNPFAQLKKGQQTPLTWQSIDSISSKNSNAIIPIGHACFIIDLNGIRLLIDPVVAENRVMKRYTKVPLAIPELTNVDYLLLSHNHRDHIDKSSVIQICQYNPNAIILTGLEVGKILKAWGVKNQIQEAGWYQQYKTPASLTIDYLPSQHWSRRWLTDTNTTLWGSFMIQDNVANKTIYFASDSGYGAHFADIGSAYQIDLAMIGVGAYEPQWFMKSAHTGPADAIRAFKDLNAKRWMPMHYGTFDLSAEPIFYPEKVLIEQHAEVLSQISWMRLGERIAF